MTRLSMPYEQTVEIRIKRWVRVRFSHSGRPIERYSVVLIALVDGTWQTIRVYDNHRGKHHMHRYQRGDSGRNRPPQGTLGTNNRLMEKLGKSKNTPGTNAAFDLLGRIAGDLEADDRYPNETVFIPADSPNASELMTEAVSEERPIAIVFPDGSDVVWRPPDEKGLAFVLLVGLLWVADHVRRKRDRPTFVPRDWVTEFHAANASASQEIAA